MAVSPPLWSILIIAAIAIVSIFLFTGTQSATEGFQTAAASSTSYQQANHGDLYEYRVKYIYPLLMAMQNRFISQVQPNIDSLNSALADSGRQSFNKWPDWDTEHITAPEQYLFSTSSSDFIIKKGDFATELQNKLTEMQRVLVDIQRRANTLYNNMLKRNIAEYVDQNGEAANENIVVEFVDRFNVLVSYMTEGTTMFDITKYAWTLSKRMSYVLPIPENEKVKITTRDYKILQKRILKENIDPLSGIRNPTADQYRFPYGLSFTVWLNRRYNNTAPSYPPTFTRVLDGGTLTAAAANEALLSSQYGANIKFNDAIQHEWYLRVSSADAQRYISQTGQCLPEFSRQTNGGIVVDAAAKKNNDEKCNTLVANSNALKLYPFPMRKVMRGWYFNRQNRVKQFRNETQDAVKLEEYTFPVDLRDPKRVDAFMQQFYTMSGEIPSTIYDLFTIGDTIIDIRYKGGYPNQIDSAQSRYARLFINGTGTTATVTGYALGKSAACSFDLRYNGAIEMAENDDPGNLNYTPKITLNRMNTSPLNTNAPLDRLQDYNDLILTDLSGAWAKASSNTHPSTLTGTVYSTSLLGYMVVDPMTVAIAWKESVFEPTTNMPSSTYSRVAIIPYIKSYEVYWEGQLDEETATRVTAKLAANMDTSANIIDASGFQFKSVLIPSAGSTLAISWTPTPKAPSTLARPAGAPATVAVNIPILTIPTQIQKPVPEQALLDNAGGICVGFPTQPGVTDPDDFNKPRCSDPIILDAIVRQYNSDKTRQPIIKVLKAHTATPFQCDLLVEIEQVKKFGWKEGDPPTRTDTRKFLVRANETSCKYELLVNPDGMDVSGHFIQSNTPLLSVPYIYGPNILSDIKKDLDSTGGKTLSTIQTTATQVAGARSSASSNTLQAYSNLKPIFPECPGLDVRSPSFLIRAIIAYANANWQTNRISKILYGGSLVPYQTDYVAEIESLDTDGKVVSTSTGGLRVKWKQISPCSFDVDTIESITPASYISFQGISPNPPINYTNPQGTEVFTIKSKVVLNAIQASTAADKIIRYRKTGVISYFIETQKGETVSYWNVTGQRTRYNTFSVSVSAPLYSYNLSDLQPTPEDYTPERRAKFLPLSKRDKTIIRILQVAYPTIPSAGDTYWGQTRFSIDEGFDIYFYYMLTKYIFNKSTYTAPPLVYIQESAIDLNAYAPSFGRSFVLRDFNLYTYNMVSLQKTIYTEFDGAYTGSQFAYSIDAGCKVSVIDAARMEQIIGMPVAAVSKTGAESWEVALVGGELLDDYRDAYKTVDLYTDLDCTLKADSIAPVDPVSSVFLYKPSVSTQAMYNSIKQILNTRYANTFFGETIYAQYVGIEAIGYLLDGRVVYKMGVQTFNGKTFLSDYLVDIYTEKPDIGTQGPVFITVKYKRGANNQPEFVSARQGVPDVGWQSNIAPITDATAIPFLDPTAGLTRFNYIRIIPTADVGLTRINFYKDTSLINDIKLIPDSMSWLTSSPDTAQANPGAGISAGQNYILSFATPIEATAISFMFGRIAFPSAVRFFIAGSRDNHFWKKLCRTSLAELGYTEDKLIRLPYNQTPYIPFDGNQNTLVLNRAPIEYRSLGEFEKGLADDTVIAAISRAFTTLPIKPPISGVPSYAQYLKSITSYSYNELTGECKIRFQNVLTNKNYILDGSGGLLTCRLFGSKGGEDFAPGTDDESISLVAPGTQELPTAFNYVPSATAVLPFGWGGIPPALPEFGKLTDIGLGLNKEMAFIKNEGWTAEGAARISKETAIYALFTRPGTSSDTDQTITNTFYNTPPIYTQIVSMPGTTLYYKKALGLVPVKFLRWTPTKTRSGTGGYQVGKLYFYVGPNAMNHPDIETTTASTTGSDSVQSLVGGDDFVEYSDSVLSTIKVTLPYIIFITGFGFLTGVGDTANDPVQWTLEGSLDGDSWTTVQSQTTDYTTPTGRFAATLQFPTTAGVAAGLTPSPQTIPDLKTIDNCVAADISGTLTTVSQSIVSVPNTYVSVPDQCTVNFIATNLVDPTGARLPDINSFTGRNFRFIYLLSRTGNDFWNNTGFSQEQGIQGWIQYGVKGGQITAQEFVRRMQLLFNQFIDFMTARITISRGGRVIIQSSYKFTILFSPPIQFVVKGDIYPFSTLTIGGTPDIYTQKFTYTTPFSVLVPNYQGLLSDTAIPDSPSNKINITTKDFNASNLEVIGAYDDSTDTSYSKRIFGLRFPGAGTSCDAVLSKAVYKPYDPVAQGQGTFTGANGQEVKLPPIVNKGVTQFQYLRFRVFKLRGPTQKGVRLAKLLFYNADEYLPLSGVTAYSTTGTDGGTAAAALQYENDTTEWQDSSLGILWIKLPSVMPVDGFGFVTGYGESERDPVRWRLEGSADGVTWQLLHDQTASDYATPAFRMTATPLLYFYNAKAPRYAGNILRRTIQFCKVRCDDPRLLQKGADALAARGRLFNPSAYGYQDDPNQCDFKQLEDGATDSIQYSMGPSCDFQVVQSLRGTAAPTPVKGDFSALKGIDQCIDPTSGQALDPTAAAFASTMQGLNLNREWDRGDAVLNVNAWGTNLDRNEVYYRLDAAYPYTTSSLNGMVMGVQFKKSTVCETTPTILRASQPAAAGAAATQSFPAAGAAGYRYFRFRPLRMRGGATAPAIAINKMFLFGSAVDASGFPVALDLGAATLTSPQGGAPMASGAENTKGTDYTKRWIDPNKTPLVIALPAPAVIVGYTWMTSPDSPNFDPVSWRLDGSTNGYYWTTLHTVTNYSDTRGFNYRKGPLRKYRLPAFFLDTARAPMPLPQLDPAGIMPIELSLADCKLTPITPSVLAAVRAFYTARQTADMAVTGVSYSIAVPSITGYLYDDVNNICIYEYQEQFVNSTAGTTTRRTYRSYAYFQFGYTTTCNYTPSATNIIAFGTSAGKLGALFSGPRTGLTPTQLNTLDSNAQKAYFQNTYTGGTVITLTATAAL